MAKRSADRRADAQHVSAGPGNGFGLDFSLFFFSSQEAGDSSGGYDLLMRCVEIGDREGLHAVWVPERHFSDFGALFPNPSVLGAAIASATDRIGIRAGSVVVPLHDPVRLVEEWSVVDNLSGGRVGLSFATGWNPDDFVLQPDAFSNRRQLASEQIAIVRALWAGLPIRRRNGSGALVEVAPRPRPIQPELPVWLTAVSAAGFERAARVGAGVLSGLMDMGLDMLADAATAYRAAHAGPGAPRVTLALHTYLDPVPGRASQLARGPLADYLGAHLQGGRAALAEIGDTVERLDADDRRSILRRVADRYIASRSLIGSPAEAALICRGMRAAGVDEIACLVDFGLPSRDVLAGLEELLYLRDRMERELRTS